MGTINYGHNKYINIGLNINKLGDYYNKYSGDEDDENYYDSINIMYEEIENILEKYNFYYYRVILNSGYYEGFYIDIDNNFPCCFDSWEDKREAQKELTMLKKFLLECVNNSYYITQYFPGWCTGYNTLSGTKKAINDTIKLMREEIKNTPTWYLYENNIYK